MDDKRIEMKNCRAKKLSHTPNIETREYSGLESHDVCIGVSIVISGMPQSHSLALPQSSHYSSASKLSRVASFSFILFLSPFLGKVKSPKNKQRFVLRDI